MGRLLPYCKLKYAKNSVLDKQNNLISFQLRPPFFISGLGSNYLTSEKKNSTMKYKEHLGKSQNFVLTESGEKTSKYYLVIRLFSLKN